MESTLARARRNTNGQNVSDTMESTLARARRTMRLGVVATVAMLVASVAVGVHFVDAQTATPTTPTTLSVYNSGLSDGFQDWGWTTRTIGIGNPATIDLGGWSGWIIAHPAGPIGLYGALRFKVKVPQTAVTGGVFIKLENALGAGAVAPLDFSGFAPDAAGWRHAEFPLSVLQPVSDFDRIIFVGQGDLPTPTDIVLDQIEFVGGVSTAARFGLAPVASTNLAKASQVDCAVANRPIDPRVYGIAFDGQRANDTTQFALGATSRRLGGNPTSRLNYDLGNAWNTAQDWYFENIGADRAWTEIMNENKAAGMGSAMTLPMIGWVAKDTTSNGFPKSLVPDQASFDPWRPDAGNGVALDWSTKLPGGDPTRTSTAIDAATIGRYAKMVSAHAKSIGGSLDEVILDNEPDLWNSTHRDIRPTPLGFSELIAKTIAASRAIRSATPDTKIAGLASWGVLGYLYSAADVATTGFPQNAPDRNGPQNGEALVPAYLRSLKLADARDGMKSIDLLDVHFYPQADGVYSPNISPSTAALRIRSTRALWDPTYADESWIKWTETPNIDLLNRLHGWIDSAYPGTGISIGEWSFGGESHMSGALATAETLGQFGRGGVSSAYYWTFPGADTPTAMAFRAFRNYDGVGGRFGDTSVSATSDPGAVADRLSMFASKTSDGKVVLVALNLSQTASMDTSISLANCGALNSYRTFTYDGSSTARFSAHTARPLGASPISVQLPPYSIAVMELSPATTAAVCPDPSFASTTTTTPPTSTTTAAPDTATSTTTLPTTTSATTASATPTPGSTGGTSTESTTSLSAPTTVAVVTTAVATSVLAASCTPATTSLVQMPPVVTIARQPFVPATTSPTTSSTTTSSTTTSTTTSSTTSTTTLKPTTTTTTVKPTTTTKKPVATTTTKKPTTTTTTKKPVTTTTKKKTTVTTTSTTTTSTTTTSPPTTTTTTAV